MIWSFVSFNQFRKWWWRILVVIVLLVSLIGLQPFVRNARLIHRVNKSNGYFYSSQHQIINDLPDQFRRILKSALVPNLQGLLGRHWPGIFKKIKMIKYGSTATAAETKYLKGQIHLEWLSLQDIPLSSDDLKPLLNLDSLTHLDLAGTWIEDNAVEVLARCHQIESINLNDTNITEVGLKMLLDHPNLTRLGVPATVPVHEVENFRLQKSNCKVIIAAERYHFMRPQNAMP